MRRCLLLNPGMVEYGRAWDFQKRLFHDRSHDRITDTVILLQHPPTYTFGRRSLPEQTVFEEGYNYVVPVYRVDRGGGATYHGPGQIIAYPILGLRTYTNDFYTYLRMLEDVIMGTLKDFDISSERVGGYTGVWVDGKKIGAIGVKIVKGFTMHGLSLNVNNDLAPFSKIVPCNIHGVEITSMSKILSTTLSISEVETSLANNFGRVFNVDMEIGCIENRIQNNHIQSIAYRVVVEEDGLVSVK